MARRDTWPLQGARSIIETSLATILFSLLPFVVPGFGAGPDATWRISTALFAALAVVGSFGGARRIVAVASAAGAAPASASPLFPSTTLNLGVGMLELLGANALGFSLGSAATVYLACLLGPLSVAGLTFLPMVVRACRSPPPEEDATRGSVARVDGGPGPVPLHSPAVSDLPTRRPSAPLAPSLEEVETVHAVLRSVSFVVTFDPPELQRVLSVMGNVVLDYREAELPPGITAIDCRVVLGNVEILVPLDVDVELTGSVLLGNVEADLGGPRSPRSRAGAGPGEAGERPLLSVDCSGVMGNVEVRRC